MYDKLISTELIGIASVCVILGFASGFFIGFVSCLIAILSKAKKYYDNEEQA